MNVFYICRKFQNDLTLIYEDMGPFICAHLSVILSVLVETYFTTIDLQYSEISVLLLL